MSSYDKVVKLACKPKAAPPKAKYLDQIIAATWSEDGAVHDVCKALSPRFREPNVIVVFKALIVLHVMIRNGSTDNVLSYLSSSEVLRLQNVSDGNWEGYDAPQHLQNYANYLNIRIRAYRDLKHDAIRVQSESNRDLRNTNSIEEDSMRGRRKGRGSAGVDKSTTTSGPTRSKTIMGRKLRLMSVEKGLLRETKIVQRMTDSLLECRFYLGDLEDELTTTALRMLVMDLLILFQAGNEGVINVLEHYFEMSRVDAKEALQIYRRFCKQTEGVVEFLGVAKKLQNLLNVPIPNLKHAPVSLAGALQEYLDDPNFEQNRLEYKANKDALVKGPSSVPKQGSTSSSQDKNKASAASTSPASATSTAPTSKTSDKPASNQAVIDFLSAIEEEQPTIFNQQNSPTSSAPNPFAQLGMTTGQLQPFASQSSPMQMQPTGFLVSQQTAFQPQFQTNSFGLQRQQQPSLQIQSTGFLQPNAQNGGMLQPTGGEFLRPQATGANPFRQSMMFPQATGMAMFGPQANPGQFQQYPLQAQPSSAGPMSGASSSSFLTATSATSSAFSTSPSAISPFSQPPSASAFALPTRPASTPLTSFISPSQQPSSMSPPAAQPVKTHQTGSRNPFGSSVVEAPPVPKPPTLMELAMGAGAPSYTNINGSVGQAPQSPPQPAGNGLDAFGGFSINAGAPGGSAMSSVASTFSFANKNKDDNKNAPGYSFSSALSSQNTSTTATGSAFSDSLASSSPFSQPTGATTISTTSAPSVSLSPTLQPQTTGFAGLKPFKPTSSFGAALLDSLPAIPGPSSTNSSVTGSFSSPTSGVGSLNSTPGGFAGSGMLGVGLRPQMTGSGAVNPFRASMMVPPSSTASGFGGQPSQFGLGNSMGMSAPSTNGMAPSFGATLFGGSVAPFASSFNSVAGQGAPNRQQSGPSLI